MMTSPDVAHQVAGCAIFAVVWVLLLRSHWPWMPLGRAVSALVGAAAFVATGVLSPTAAFAAINVETIALLTGCMLVSAHLEKQGGFALMTRLLAKQCSPRVLLARVCAVAAISASLLTNDTTCIIFTPIVLAACRSRQLHPAPFLLAVATAANIGASCSPVGSPQAMIIAVEGGISFLRFLGWLGLPTVIGVIVNYFIILVLYWNALSPGATYVWVGTIREGDHHFSTPLGADIVSMASESTADAVASFHNRTALSHGTIGGVIDNQPATSGPVIDSATVDAVSSVGATVQTAACIKPHTQTTCTQQSTIATASDGTSLSSRPGSTVAQSQIQSPRPPTVWQSRTAAGRIFIVRTLLVAFPLVLIFADAWIGLGWTTLVFAAALCVVDGDDPGPLLRRVDGELLLFFSCLFICVAGLNATGIPGDLWDSFASTVTVRTPAGVAAFSFIVLVGSQLVSNVPLVLLIAPKILEMAPIDAAVAWALLEWVSTVAGNLTLLGSVANLIVAERAKSDYEIRFLEYGRVGVPSTLLMCLFGVPLAWVLANSIG